MMKFKSFLLVAWAFQLFAVNSEIEFYGSNTEFWSLVEEVDLNNPKTKAATDVFSFTMPTFESGKVARMQMKFGSSNNGSDCNGTAVAQAFNNICLDASRSGKTYALSPVSLYTIANLLGSNATNASCVRLRDNNDFDNIQLHTNISCSSSPCTSDGGNFSLLALTPALLTNTGTGAQCP